MGFDVFLCKYGPLLEAAIYQYERKYGLWALNCCLSTKFIMLMWRGLPIK